MEVQGAADDSHDTDDDMPVLSQIDEDKRALCRITSLSLGGTDQLLVRLRLQMCLCAGACMRACARVCCGST